MEPQLTGRTIAILAELLSDPRRPRYGLDLSKEAGVRASTAYDVLIRLEESGWVESEWESAAPAEVGRPRRRLYRLTGLGESAARNRIQGEIEKLQSALAPPEGESAGRPRLGAVPKPSPAAGAR